MEQKNEHSNPSFLSHLETLRWHIIRAFIAICIGSVIAFLQKTLIFENILFAFTKNTFPTYIALCNISEGLCIKDLPFNLINIEITGPFTTPLLVSFIGGFIIAFPYVLYEIWLFISPAMYKTEKRNSLLFFFFSFFLFLFGIFFAYYVIVPFGLNFLTNYSLGSALNNEINFISYIGLISKIILAAGLLFQLPVLIYILTKLNLISPSQLKQYRRHAFVIILIIASILTPPDIFSQILIGLPVFLLYEFSIFIASLKFKKE